MAKKSTSPVPVNPAVLKSHIDEAFRDNRTKIALKLAKQLHEQEGSPESRDLLVRAYLERARQAREEVGIAEAAAILQNALPLVQDDPEKQAMLARELDACRASAPAAMPAPDHAPDRPKIQPHQADAAVTRGPNSRSEIPAELRPQFDLVMGAFALLEKEQDEAVREKLQGIGLQSPFLEWKLLIRGLQAYYVNDDARAIENWSRLDTQRLPARLAAPIRFIIDPAFRQAQPPASREVLKRQADPLLTTPLALGLKTLQKLIAQECVDKAFRSARTIVPALKQQAPALVPRLGWCLYWAIIQNGEPEDMDDFRRLFTPPADDPQLYRLEAMALEERDAFGEAAKYWKKYEKWLASKDSSFPPNQIDRARAIIWCHLGMSSAKLPSPEQLKPAMLAGPGKSLLPSFKEAVVKCFVRSLELAPDLEETHVALVSYCIAGGQLERAEQAAEAFLAQFPDSLPALEVLSTLLLKRKAYARGTELLERAVKIQPLDRDLRDRASHAYLWLAREHSEAGLYDQARAAYQASADIHPPPDFTNCCKRAIMELKAGEPAQAETWMVKAREAGPAAAVTYCLMVEAIRLALPAKLKTRFNNDWKAVLATQPDPASALKCVLLAATYKQVEVSYRGQATHEKKVWAFLEKAPFEAFTEDQLIDAARCLMVLNARKVGPFCDKAQSRFPTNPHFPFLQAEALFAGKKRPRVWQIAPLLNRAKNLAEKQPDRYQKLLEQIEALRERWAEMDPFTPFRKLFGPLGIDEYDGWEDADD